MPRVVAVIPARSGSKGVPDKNVRLLGGYPLMVYSIMAARLAHKIDQVVVSTDSATYAAIAREYKANVPFLRPESISGDSNTDYEMIKHFLDWSWEVGEEADLIVHMRPTTPFRNPALLDSAIELFTCSTEATSLRSVHEMPESAYKMLEIENGVLKPLASQSFDMETANLPRHCFPKTYAGNGYVDVLKSSYIINEQKLHGDHVLAYRTPVAHEVDTFDDFHFLEYQAEKHPEYIQRLFS